MEEDMAHAEATVTIDRPIADVFQFILDGTQNPLWRPDVIDIVKMPNSPNGAGAAYEQGMKGPGGRRIDADYEITELKPNESIKFQVTAGPARPNGTYQFSSIGNSTTVTFILDFQPKGLAKLMDGMINSQMKSEVATLSNLKAYLESRK
jgi:uncharacterized membrane protein